MRSILITMIASFLIVTTMSGQGHWKIVNEGFDFYITDFDIINADTAWICGSKDILKTTDGGNKWISLPGEEEYFNIDFINSSVGWAVESQPDSIFIVKTVDGGQSWIRQRIVDNSVDLKAVTEHVVYAVGNSILKTIDGGSNWDNITPAWSSDFSSACFINADTGIVISFGRVIRRTFDGGATWDRIIPFEFSELIDIKFLNDSTGYFLALDTSSNFRLYKTTDSFNSWSAISDDRYSIYGYQPFDNDVIISLIVDSTGINIMKSYDDGLTWEDTNAMKLPSSWSRFCKLYFSNNTGYLFGSDGYGSTLLKSVDQGNNWRMIKFSYPFKDVCFIDEEKGFMVGGIALMHSIRYGNLFKTDDGCETFNLLLESANGFPLFSCHFISDSIGFVSGMRVIHKTSEGGNNWTVCEGIIVGQDSIEYNVRDPFFINDSVGWCNVYNRIDVSQRIYKTIDGGETWSIFHQFEIEQSEFLELNSIFFIDENTGWVLCKLQRGNEYQNNILKYTEELGWNEILTGIDNLLKKVFFVDRDNGWISGGYSNNNDFKPLLLRTEDGGLHWRQTSGLNYLINDFYFENKLHGWAVGEEDLTIRGFSDRWGVILESSDGGDTWDIIMDSLSGPLNALDFKDGYGWVVGDNGLVLKTEYTPATGIGEDDPAKEREKNLFQNYPNPFISATTISYQLPETSDVELSIFDLSGRKVITLINETQQIGEHEVEWNAEGMQPGIYIGTLKTLKNRQVIKMILID